MDLTVAEAVKELCAGVRAAASQLEQVLGDADIREQVPRVIAGLREVAQRHDPLPRPADEWQQLWQTLRAKLNEKVVSYVNDGAKMSPAGTFKTVIAIMDKLVPEGRR